MKNYERKIGDKFPSETLSIVFTKNDNMSQNYHYKYSEFKRHLKHIEREVELIVFENNQIAILEFNDDDEIVIDTIKEGLTIQQVKEMLDNKVSIIEICALERTEIIKDRITLINTLKEISEEDYVA